MWPRPPSAPEPRPTRLLHRLVGDAHAGWKELDRLPGDQVEPRAADVLLVPGAQQPVPEAVEAVLVGGSPRQSAARRARPRRTGTTRSFNEDRRCHAQCTLDGIDDTLVPTNEKHLCAVRATQTWMVRRVLQCIRHTMCLTDTHYVITISTRPSLQVGATRSRIAGRAY